MKNRDIILQQRPLFNHSSDSLLHTAGTIIDILKTYNKQMDSEIEDCFEKDIHVILNEMAQRN